MGCPPLSGRVAARLMLGWSGSPGFWGVMAAAAEHAHCNTMIKMAQVVRKGAEMMSHVCAVDLGSR